MEINKDFKFFYQSSTMRYGDGYWIDKNLPNFPIVTKTLTLYEKMGTPFLFCPIPFTGSWWNHIGLHNCGYYNYIKNYGYLTFQKDVIISISSPDNWLDIMVYQINEDTRYGNIKPIGIELNFSCPNIKDQKNIKIPKSNLPLYLKLRYDDDPERYDLTNIKGIRLNSVPMMNGGVSGKLAQKYNWSFIKTHLQNLTKDGITLAGSSWICYNDIKRLEDLGVTEFGIGIVKRINPKLVRELGVYKK